MNSVPKTLHEAIKHFADYENCHKFMIELRWPDGKVKCPRCGSDNVAYLPNAKVFKCYEKHERQKFSLKVGTIFEDSPIPLEKWLTAVWLVCNCKNGISSYEIHRDLGITQKSTWFMAHRIRRAMHDGSFDKFTGECEADETFIGGKARNMHKNVKARRITGTGSKDKTAVMGILERGDKAKGTHSKVVTMVVPDRKKKTLQNEVKAHVQAGAALYSDALLSYDGLEKDFAHQVVDHAVEYVRGKVHTNGLENFWSLTDRMINGTYVSIEPFHTFRYLDEESFRFNNRGHHDAPVNDGDRFILAMSQIVGKRLTYKELTGKLNASPAECF
ncbi:MAG TPA: IS1595 family transposase [Candidatus Angelobacter sp.]|jgi:transposase-like protein|nr:IS1595 family transposase [Candidatus Angelobacter sp.]